MRRGEVWLINLDPIYYIRFCRVRGRPELQPMSCRLTGHGPVQEQ
jgi:hypothetical protein